MSVGLDLQLASAAEGVPPADSFERWTAAALEGRRSDVELTVRVVDAEESAALNEGYRHRAGPTNVLSFPAPELPASVPALLGDIVVCAPLVAAEAAEQGKALEAHWAHLTVHGVLHLLGFDHVEVRQAAEMEALEVDILASLGYPNPYQTPQEDPANHV